jgi:hypothetical protein
VIKFCDSKITQGNQAMQSYNIKIAIASMFIPLVPNGTKVCGIADCGLKIADL